MTIPMSSHHSGKNTQAALVSSMIAGLKKNYPNGSTVLSLGGNHPPATVDAVTGQLGQLVANRAAVVTAQAVAQEAVDKEQAAWPALVAFAGEVEAFVRFTCGTSATALADYGLPVPKVRTPLTAEQKAVAAAKRAATRKARGTTSAKQKKAIKGNVSVAVVVTPAEPAVATPAPAVAPAATAAAATAAPTKA